MTKMRYSGVINPRREFEAMRPTHAALIKMMATCRPFGPDYKALLAAADALKAAADHFMPGEQPAGFFARDPHSS